MQVIGGKAQRQAVGCVGYVRRIQVHWDTQPVAVALIEAKPSTFPLLMPGRRRRWRYSAVSAGSANGERGKMLSRTPNPVVQIRCNPQPASGEDH